MSTRKILLVCAMALSVATLCDIYICSITIPYVNGDSMFFLPQIINYSAGAGLNNPFYERALNYSPHHDGRHIWHGYLLQVLSSALMRSSNYASLLEAQRIINGATLSFFTIYSYFSLRATSKGLPLVFVFISLLALVGYSLGLQGRPETLSMAIYAAAVLATRLPIRILRAAVLGVLCTANFLTSPLHGVILSAFVLMFCIYSCVSSIQLIIELLTAILGGLLAFPILLFLYPFELQELVRGIRMHSAAVLHSNRLIDAVSLRSWRQYLIDTGHFFPLGLLVICMIASSFFPRLLAGRNSATKWGLWVLWLAVLTAIIYYFNVSGWYVLTAISPLILSVGVIAVLHGTDRQSLIIVSIGAIIAIDPVLHMVGGVATATRVSYHEAATLLASDIPAGSAGIAVSTGGLMLINVVQANRILAYEQYIGPKIDTDAEYFVLVQEWPIKALPVYENFTLLHSRLNLHSPPWAIGRLRQWFGNTDYSYAIYSRNDSKSGE